MIRSQPRKYSLKKAKGTTSFLKGTKDAELCTVIVFACSPDLLLQIVLHVVKYASGSVNRGWHFRRASGGILN